MSFGGTAGRVPGEGGATPPFCVKDGRVLFASAPGVAETQLAATTLTPGGDLSAVAYGNSMVLTVAGRDPQGRVTDAQWSKAGTLFARSQQVYNQSGVVTSGTDSTSGNQVTTAYTYDALGRLTNAAAGRTSWA